VARSTSTRSLFTLTSATEWFARLNLPTARGKRPGRLLRPRRERPSRRATAEKRDELARLQLIKLHSILGSSGGREP
jgi:hypothetical protein